MLAGCNSGTFGPGEDQLARTRERLRERHAAVVGMSTPDNDFVPATVTVAPGDSVAWLNDSEWGHTVTAREAALPESAAFFASGGFDSERAAREAWPDGDLDVGETFTHRFTVAGEHPYVCVPHEDDDMVGTVVVEE
jgi:plastocyanin